MSDAMSDAAPSAAQAGRGAVVRALRTGGRIAAGLAALGVVGGLGALAVSWSTGGTGTRDEGPVHEEVTEKRVVLPSASPSPARTRVNAVRLLMDDPRVSRELKEDLRPCTGGADSYPLDVIYGDLTDSPRDDVVINVLTCGDSVGIATYVYRPDGEGYANVHRSEDSPVYAEIDRGDLVVTRQVYHDRDPVAVPSGEDVVTYRWKADSFEERARTYNDYSGTTGSASPVPPGN
ncbi:hypothetical protein JNUCC64_20040 [Streptomyces sp. JNUCC 64]